MESAYITIRYYSDVYGLRFKIVSYDKDKTYDLFEHMGHGEWVRLQRFSKFKWAYDFVKDIIDNE